MKVRIEILHFEDGDDEPKVVGAISHEASAIEPVAAAAQGVIDSGELPESVNGYRIITETGIEYLGWPTRTSGVSILREG